jgi:hypothetical protein
MKFRIQVELGGKTATGFGVAKSVATLREGRQR